MKYLAISDLQIPYTDWRAVEAMLADAQGVDGVLCVGDEIDFPQVSRWSKGWAAEYERTLQQHVDANFNFWLRVRDQFGDIPIHISRSNHVDRLERYVERYAPALRSLGALEVEHLLHYDRLGIAYHRAPFEFAPGWLLCHGDEGSLSRIAGRTAGLLAERFNRNIICGHTHRQGRTATTYGTGSAQRTVIGVEIGHLMDVRRAHYVTNPDWQQGYAEVYTDGRSTEVVLRTFNRRKLAPAS